MAAAEEGQGARQVERDGAVATISLDDPASRNALTDEALGWLAASLVELDGDPEVRAIVVGGSEKVFVSGADIKALQRRGVVDVYLGERFRSWDAIHAVRTPLVAAVAGFALGAGCELALMADVTVAAENARFGLPETQFGLLPGAGGTQRLPRAIGKAKAMDMVLTGRMLDANEAEAAGLVSRVVPLEQLGETVAEIAATIAARPAVAQSLAKRLVADAAGVGLPAGLDSERSAFLVAFGTEDAAEGLSAFIEKRDATFRHR